MPICLLGSSIFGYFCNIGHQGVCRNHKRESINFFAIYRWEIRRKLMFLQCIKMLQNLYENLEKYGHLSG